MTELLDDNQPTLPSTTLDNRQTEEQGLRPMPEPDEKPGSTRDAISKALDDAEAADKEDKPAKVEKTPEPPTEKEEKTPAKESEPEKPAAVQEETKKPLRTEGQQPITPPARFLPKAKEVWQNVPHAVKTEIARLEAERDQETTQYREAKEEHERLTPHREYFKQTYQGASVSDALDRFVHVDKLLRTDPARGVGEILRSIGLTPQQYAHHVMQNPQAHADLPRQQQAPQQVQQPAPETESIKAELQQMREQMTHAQVIAPFAARPENSRYQELEPAIAQILRSGMIPASLSLEQKLETAYDMAARLNPTSSYQPEPQQTAEPEPVTRQPVVDPLGERSIRGAPPSGVDPKSRRSVSRNEAITSALAEMGL